MRMKLLVVALALTALALPRAQAVYLVGDLVADFCLQSAPGATVCFYSYDGYVALMTFWTYTCTTCREEAEWIEDNLWAVYASQGLIVLSIGAGENQATAQSWVSETGVTYPVLADPGNTVYPLFGTTSVFPHNAVTDRAHILGYNSSGYDPSRLASVVAELVSTPGPGASATPTPAPTEPPPATPTPTPTSPDGTPTPTPTGGTGELTVEIETSQATYYPGQTFLLTAGVRSTGGEFHVDRYILLDVYGAYYFWPGWTQTLDFASEDYSGPFEDSDTILTFTWPSGAGTAAGIKFWHACLTSGTSSLASNVAMVEWGFAE